MACLSTISSNVGHVWGPRACRGGGGGKKGSIVGAGKVSWMLAICGTEWTERPPLCAFVDHFFLFVFSSLLLPHTWHSTYCTLRSNTRWVQPTRSNHGPSLPHCSAHFSFLSSSLYPIDVVSCSRMAFINTKLLQRGICMCHHLSYYPPLYVLIFSLFNHHHRCPRGNLQYRP